MTTQVVMIDVVEDVNLYYVEYCACMRNKNTPPFSSPTKNFISLINLPHQLPGKHFGSICVCVCVCCSRYPGRMPFLNYEAVEFQPRTVANPALDSGCPTRIL